MHVKARNVTLGPTADNSNNNNKKLLLFNTCYIGSCNIYKNFFTDQKEISID